MEMEKKEDKKIKYELQMKLMTMTGRKEAAAATADEEGATPK